MFLNSEEEFWNVVSAALLPIGAERGEVSERSKGAERIIFGV